MHRRIDSAFLLSVLAAALVPIGSAVHAQSTAPASVETAVAVETRLAPTRWVPGSVVSRDDARIASAVAGRVMEIVEVGTRIGRGERLARLDSAALRLRLEQVRAEAGRAKAQRDLAASQMARFERLAGGQVVAQAQIDEVRATLAGAEQELARTQAVRRGIEHEIGETEIRAPFDGIVSERFVQRGEYLNVGAAVAHVVDTTRLEARVRAPLALAARLAEGQEIQVRLAGRTHSASVRAIVPVGDERTRQFELRVALPGDFALVGSAIDVALPESAGVSSVAVPRDALVLRESQTYVMRVTADGIAERVVVIPGVVRDELVEVDAGSLNAGDRVVVRGAERLTDGQSVRDMRAG